MSKIPAPLMLLPMILIAACSSESGDDQGTVTAPVGSDGGDAPAGLSLDSGVGEGGILVQSEGTGASFDPDCIISETGAAGIEMSETLGGFVEAFPSGTGLSFEPQFMVDFGSLCARSGGEDALCVIFESYEVDAYNADIPILAMGVYADQCRTAEGIGPGISIADAVTAYGPARFGFSYENEGREYVSFDGGPDAYSFRAQSAIGDALNGDALRAPGPHGGDYAGVEGDSYFETTVAQPDAEIWELWISTPL